MISYGFQSILREAGVRAVIELDRNEEEIDRQDLVTGIKFKFVEHGLALGVHFTIQVGQAPAKQNRGDRRESGVDEVVGRRHRLRANCPRLNRLNIAISEKYMLNVFHQGVVRRSLL